jgi:HEAT repeat protein
MPGCQPSNLVPINTLDREDQLKVLLRALSSTDTEQRRVGAVALGAVEPSAWEVIPDLVNSVRHDADAAVRVNAIRSLGEIDLPEDEVIAALRHALRDENAEVAIEAAELFGDMGRLAEPAVPGLVAMLESPRTSVRLAALAALVRLNARAGEETVPVLTRLLDDPNCHVASYAAEMLLRMGHGRLALRSYLRRLASQHTPRKTLWDLARMGTDAEEAIPVVLAILQDAESEHRRAAVEALGSIGADSSEALTAVVATLWDQDEEVRTGARYALQGMKPEGDNSLTALVSASGDLVRKLQGVPDAFDGYDMRGGAGAIPEARVLLEFIEPAEGSDGEWQYRGIELLARSSPNCTEIKRELMDKWQRQSGEGVAGDLAIVLGRNGYADEVVPRLVELMANDDALVRLSAIETLRGIGPPAKKAVPALLVAAESGPGPAARALGSIGVVNEAVLDTLFGMLDGSDRQVRSSAAFALVVLMASEDAVANNGKIARALHDKLFSLLVRPDDEVEDCIYDAFLMGSVSGVPGAIVFWTEQLASEDPDISYMAFHVLMALDRAMIVQARPAAVRVFKRGNRNQEYARQLLRKIDGRRYETQRNSYAPE